MDREYGESKWESKRKGMGKHNRSWTERQNLPRNGNHLELKKFQTFG